jgi:hypothetical protein
MSRVSELLGEFGQILRPIETAPTDGRMVLCYSEHFGLVAVHWQAEPLPKWVMTEERGFLDRAFLGWYDPAGFRPIGESELTRLLVAFIDDMRAQDRQDILKALELPPIPKQSNDNA